MDSLMMMMGSLMMMMGSLMMINDDEQFDDYDPQLTV
jgi:hypothetical protein